MDEFRFSALHYKVEKHIPGKQGLKLFFPHPLRYGCRVEKHIPGKQGLKQEGDLTNDPIVDVEKHIPGKQGLKHRYGHMFPEMTELKNTFQENKD